LKINLTQGQKAIVDQRNFDLIEFKWGAIRQGSDQNPRWYAVRKGNIRMHRVIMERELGRILEAWEKIDHKNGNGLDNRVDNLRIVNSKQNGQNQQLQGRSKTSQYKGVSFAKTKWRAYITIDGKLRHLGLFNSEEDAAKAYDQAAEYVYEKYACLNFPKY
jgi:hypothetical protein